MGLVWFATSNGVVKYDGEDYKNYDTEHGLKDALIYDIHKDIKGDFWVSTEFGGVARLENDIFVYPEELKDIDTLVINHITNAPDGTLWFGSTEKGVFQWDEEGALTQIISEENGLPDNQVWDISFDEEENAWISTSSGTAVYDDEISFVREFTNKNGLEGELTYHVHFASDGKKWVSTSNGVSVINKDFSIENITEIDNRPLGYVYSITEDNDGVIWIGTEMHGLYWLDGDNYTRITKKNGLSSNDIYRLIKDDKGTIWIATEGDGVNIFKDQEFQIYDSSSPLDANIVYSAIKASDGTLWFGTENGLSSYKNDTFTNYTLPSLFFEEDEIWDIEEMSNGNLIMLTYDYDLIEFDGTNFYHPDFFDELYPYYISDIFTEDDGTMWFTAFQALLKYKDGKLEEFTPPDEEYWQTDLGFITKDSRGYYWIGTELGVAQFDGQEFKYITKEDGLEGASVYDVREDDRDHLWVGTNRGISVFYDFDEDGMPKESIEFLTLDFYLQETIFLQFDQYGNLWQGTNGGMNYYDLEIWRGHRVVQQQHFPFNDYGHGIEFNGWASLIDDEGRLWFGSNSKGLIVYSFPEGETKIEKEAPPGIFLREVLANNQPIFQPGTGNETQGMIETSYDRNNLNFRFNAIDYKYPNRIVYEYKLDGLDEKWIMARNIQEVRYTNVPPGTYELLIRAKSIKSDWSTVQNLASIKIEIPFWKTTWFLILCFILSILLALFFMQYYIDRKEKRDLKRLVDDQTKDLQSALIEKEVLIKEIHHRVKNNLAVVSGLLELQSWNIEEGIAKNAIQESKMRVLAMSKIHENLYQNDDLAKVNFKKFLEDLIESVAETMRKPDHEIDLDLDVADVPMNVNIGIPLGLMVNEIVSNSFKHAFNTTKKGHIQISFEKNGTNYKLEIKDNGVGSQENVLDINSSSLGISLVKSLASQINGKVSFLGEDGAHFTILFSDLKFSS